MLNIPAAFSSPDTDQPELDQLASQVMLAMESEQGDEEEQNIFYACPMHPHETSDHAGKCSICGMFLVAQDNEEEQSIFYACPMHPHETSDHAGKCPVCGMFLVAQDNEEDENLEHDHDMSTDNDDMQHDMTAMNDMNETAMFWENINSPDISKNQRRQQSGKSDSPVTQRMLATGHSGANTQKVMHSALDKEESVQVKIIKPQQSATYICPMHPQIIQHEPGGSCPICGMDLVVKKNRAATGTVHDGQSPQVFLEAAVIQNMGVRTAKVHRKVIEKQIQTQGRVTPDDERLLSIHPRTGGWIEVLQLVTEGDRVERKDVLYDFYSPWINDVQLDFIEALEEYDQTSFDPGKKTEVGAKVDSLRNSLRLLNVSDMDIMRIKNNRKVQNTIQMMAPQGGIITRLNITEGTYVEPNQSMFTIVDLSQVWVMIDIYEHQAPWVRKGNNVEITAPAIPDRTWEGVVDFIYPEVDPKTRTLRARITIKNPDEALLLNMFVKVNISSNAGGQAVLTVPREAVILTGERKAVIKSLGKGHFQPVDVKTGKRGEGSVEILSGLELGDEIVVSGQFLIDSESSLQASFLRMSE